MTDNNPFIWKVAFSKAGTDDIRESDLPRLKGHIHMKYYIGRLQVCDGEREYFPDACIAAENKNQAETLLETRAQLFGGDDATERQVDGSYWFADNTFWARPHGLMEVSAVTFQEMAKGLPVFGNQTVGNLEAESQDERVQTLARRIGAQLAKHDAKVSHSKLLHAVAASLGETDWQVLLHKKEPSPVSESVPEVETSDWSAKGGSQRFVPGTGYLWRVPVTVDSSMTAFVKVRARDKDEAMQVARLFASEGNAKFDVDEGNYRGMADHYVGDTSDAAVHRIEDDDLSIPVKFDQNSMRAQAGPYVVELANLGDDDELFWVDLSVYDPDEEEPELESCLSACPSDSTGEQSFQFCHRVANMLYRAAPDPAKASRQALSYIFVNAVQGDQSDTALEKLEQKLKDIVLLRA